MLKGSLGTELVDGFYYNDGCILVDRNLGYEYIGGFEVYEITDRDIDYNFTGFYKKADNIVTDGLGLVVVKASDFIGNETLLVVNIKTKKFGFIYSYTDMDFYDNLVQNTTLLVGYLQELLDGLVDDIKLELINKVLSMYNLYQSYFSSMFKESHKLITDWMHDTILDINLSNLTLKTYIIECIDDSVLEDKDNWESCYCTILDGNKLKYDTKYTKDSYLCIDWDRNKSLSRLRNVSLSIDNSILNAMK